MARQRASAGRSFRRTQQKLALAIPTLREAENIRGLLGHVRAVLDPAGIDYEILVVDDDSRDGTEEIVTAIAQKDPRVRLLVRKGRARLVGRGSLRLAADGRGDSGRDGRRPAAPARAAARALIAAILDGNDLAIGSRYTAGGELGQWNPVRKLLSTAAVWATWPIQRARRARPRSR